MKIEAIRLTPDMANRKYQVLDFLRRFRAARGGNPSLMEIATACGTNKSRVQDAIRKLEKDGLVEREPGKKGGTTPVPDHALVLRELAERGYIINPPALALYDLDDDGRLTVTKSSLPRTRACAHGASIAGASTHGEKEQGRETR